VDTVFRCQAGHSELQRQMAVVPNKVVLVEAPVGCFHSELMGQALAEDRAERAKEVGGSVGEGVIPQRTDGDTGHLVGRAPQAASPIRMMFRPGRNTALSSVPASGIS